jgi:hypothetical protein
MPMEGSFSLFKPVCRGANAIAPTVASHVAHSANVSSAVKDELRQECKRAEKKKALLNGAAEKARYRLSCYYSIDTIKHDNLNPYRSHFPKPPYRKFQEIF